MIFYIYQQHFLLPIHLLIAGQKSKVIRLDDMREANNLVQFWGQTMQLLACFYPCNNGHISYNTVECEWKYCFLFTYWMWDSSQKGLVVLETMFLGQVWKDDLAFMQFMIGCLIIILSCQIFWNFCNHWQFWNRWLSRINPLKSSTAINFYCFYGWEQFLTRLFINKSFSILNTYSIIPHHVCLLITMLVYRLIL